uniref:CARD domain-containing protein n=1 Tax=Hucho hucho TaxID=62062 RepID=A0A4W5QHE6_9TELE
KLHLTVERYITDYNLEGLIEKCEGRYCVLSNKKSLILVEAEQAATYFLFNNKNRRKKTFQVVAPLLDFTPVASSANPSTPAGQAFITKHRMQLVNRLGLLQPILMRLQVQGVLSDEEMEDVESKHTKSQKNQALLNTVVRKGARAQDYFYQALRESDLLLVEDLCKCRK